MTNGNGDIVSIAQFILEAVFTNPRAGGIAAAAICQNEKAGGIGPAFDPGLFPPLRDATDRKCWSIMGSAHVEIASIDLGAVDAVQDSDAVCV